MSEIVYTFSCWLPFFGITIFNLFSEGAWTVNKTSKSVSSPITEALILFLASSITVKTIINKSASPDAWWTVQPLFYKSNARREIRPILLLALTRNSLLLIFICIGSSTFISMLVVERNLRKCPSSFVFPCSYPSKATIGSPQWVIMQFVYCSQICLKVAGRRVARQHGGRGGLHQWCRTLSLNVGCLMIHLNLQPKQSPLKICFPSSSSHSSKWDGG